jgi:alanine dehydrogenase
MEAVITKENRVANPEIAQGSNVIDRKVTYPGVAEAFGLKYTPIEKVLGQKKRK